MLEQEERIKENTQQKRIKTFQKNTGVKGDNVRKKERKNIERKREKKSAKSTDTEVY